MEIKKIRPELFHKENCYYYGLIDCNICQGRCDKNGIVYLVCKRCNFYLANESKQN